MQQPPDKFSFKYFETLPLSGDDREAEAQAYLDRRFPSGTRLDATITEFTSAGATCNRGLYNNRPYYDCRYDRPAGIFVPFVTTEWKIIIQPDDNEKFIESIVVRRGDTGL